MRYCDQISVGIYISYYLSFQKIANFIGDNRFIYFSLGTLATSETFEPEILKSLLHTFGELDQKVLWKANETEMKKHAKIPPNVLVRGWMPQLDVLCECFSR